ncbi:hypothetical protein EV144_10838 [Flavobacterium sp. 270]|uniref:hypothetical protein n=1 Tax=Flavobacterium sp. 270 TaxID=2512114 RepID=UPI001066AA3C|nr:hypothetical protein [Flavobacterium sp. 270]TDW44590.1 hypothetical protein EV144_10838 [Flavobacterium sp. 270]
MEHLPFYIKLVFILTTFFTLFLLYKAANHSKAVLTIILSWLALQTVISLTGFYTITNVMPPRFALLVLPPLLLLLAVFISSKGKQFINRLDVKTLTILHIVRIPVEITLYWLFLQKTVPEIMTFEGKNLDILCGITAPIIYYFGYIKKTLSPKIILIWNIVCLISLGNIVTTAILSAPLPFQQFAFEQPNIALLYFPFVWLPSCVVPIVLFSHLAAIKRLLN